MSPTPRTPGKAGTGGREQELTPLSRFLALSPGGMGSPAHVNTPGRITSPAGILSPTRLVGGTKLMSPEGLLSPTKFLSPGRLLSPSKIMSPSNMLSPYKLMSPVKASSTPRILSPDGHSFILDFEGFNSQDPSLAFSHDFAMDSSLECEMEPSRNQQTPERTKIVKDSTSNDDRYGDLKPLRPKALSGLS